MTISTSIFFSISREPQARVKIDVVIVFIANDVTSLWKRHIVMTSFPVLDQIGSNTEFYRIARLVSDKRNDWARTGLQ